MTSIALTTKAFDRATLAWSRDDASDNLRLMQLGETMLYAAIDLIISMECEIDRLNEEASETAKAERLLAIARKMTALGLEGEDPAIIASRVCWRKPPVPAKRPKICRSGSEHAAGLNRRDQSPCNV